MRAHCHVPGQAKVAENGAEILVQENVLWLQVSMQDSVGVEIVQGRHQVKGQPLSSLLPDGSLVGQQFMQVTRCILCDDDYFFGRLKRVQHLNYVGMTEIALDLAFPTEILQFLRGLALLWGEWIIMTIREYLKIEFALLLL